MSSVAGPGSNVPPESAAPFVRLPARDQLFRRRAQRFRLLAEDHPLGDHLNFLAMLASAQQEVLDRCPHARVQLPEPAQVALQLRQALPPIPARGWERDPAWQGAVERIVDLLMGAIPRKAQAAVARLIIMESDELEALASRILSGAAYGLDPVIAPLVGAALQVYWTHMASTLPAAGFLAAHPPGLCPVCGSTPVGSLLRTAGQAEGLRYLQCALCGTEWLLPRLTCGHCNTGPELLHLDVEGEDGVQAERCDGCGRYLKIFSATAAGDPDPTADDLATSALDRRLTRAGYARCGINLLFVPEGPSSGAK